MTREVMHTMEPDAETLRAPKLYNLTDHNTCPKRTICYVKPTDHWKIGPRKVNDILIAEPVWAGWRKEVSY